MSKYSRKVYNFGASRPVTLQGEKRDSNGDLIITQTFPNLGMVQIRQDYKFVAVAGEQTFHDVEVTTELRISGGRRYVINVDDVHENDYMEFSVIDKNGVLIEPESGLSYFQLLGLTPGVDVLLLEKFVRTSYVKKGNKSDGYMCTYEPSSIHGDPIYQGLFMRASYASFGDTDIDVVYTLLFYED